MVIGFLATMGSNAQSDTSKTGLLPGLSFSGYLEAYYSYDFNLREGHKQPYFLYQFDQHNEFSVNIGMLEATYEREWFRSAFGIQIGTLQNSNVGGEPGVFRNLYEAYAGLKIRENMWVDAGVFYSHLGFASAFSLDNPNLGAFLSNENTPYYLAGVRMAYQPNEHWSFLGVVSNGWQNMSEGFNDQGKAVGLQVCFSPSDKASLTYNNFLGQEEIDTSGGTWFFQELIWNWQPSDRFEMIAGLDFGLRKRGDADVWDQWYNPGVGMRYWLSKKWGVGGRYEFYGDPAKVIQVPSPEAFRVHGASVNVDFRVNPQAMLRVEGRGFFSQNDFLSVADGDPRHFDQSTSITASLAVQFGRD